MPSIESLPSKQLAMACFTYMHKVKLPHKWVTPALIMGADQYVKHSKGNDLSAKIKFSSGTLAVKTYVWPSSPDQDHSDIAEGIGKPTKEFVEKALDKFKQAHDMARMQAKIKGIKIMSVSCLGPPGSVDFPKLKDSPSFSSWESSEKEDNAKAYAKAVVEGLTDQFDKFHGKMAVPGLPFWPAYAAIAPAMAPPMPNVPMPAITLPSAMMAEVTQKKLCDAMIAKLSSGVKDKDDPKIHEVIFDAIAFPISLNVLLWLVSQQVMLLMAQTAPVPPWVPPYVPVGPVIAGGEAPGAHFMT